MSISSKVTLFLLALLLIFSCNKSNIPPDLDFKEEMRNFVINISQNAKSTDPDFIIIPQNGIELVTQNGEEDGAPHSDYLTAIDGHGQEDLFYGYDNDDKATSDKDNLYLRAFLDISKVQGNTILATDYCSTPSKMDDSYAQNQSQGYISFAASHRELDNIPDYPAQIFQENSNQITALSQAKNFLYLINPENFTTKNDFINAVTSTNYDVIIMDLFFQENETFTSAEISQLKAKTNGGSRLVVCYMSIGEAEDYRYYWNQDWNKNKPGWLDKENPNWKGNFKVKYWNQDWQNIIYGKPDSYLTQILEVGFDGVYLDIIDAFEYYE